MELDYVGMGKRIATRRKQAGFKQNVFAEKVGISNNYLSSIERGKEKPTLGQYRTEKSAKYRRV